jgi:hypothetical protein
VHELRFSLNREWENPFDPEQVEFWGVFESPLGDRKRIPAFYTQDYTRQLVASPEQLTPTGPPGWALRFAATTPGLYRFHLEGEDRHGALGRSETLEVRADMSPGPGYVRVDPAQRYFVRDRGDFFYPIGINLRSPTDGGQANYDFEPPTNEEGASRLESYLARMKENGITLGRVWLTPWFGGIEWSRDAPGYHGLGQYNLQNAWRIDRLLQTAEELGVFIELLLYAHGPYQGDFIEPWGKLIDSQWADNPYNVKNGGPVPRPQEFLSNVGARKGARNYLRYVAARYGAHTQLFGWTLWNEVDTVTMDIPGIAEWHREMIEVLRDNDTGKHIVSTEFRKLGYPEIWGLPEIDYVQSEAYFHRGDGGLIARFREAREMLGRLGKPAVIEEYGGGWWGGSMDLLAQNIHDGLWAAWTEGFSSAPLAWWWNLIFEKRLDAYYRVFSEFTRGEDLRGPEFSRGSPSIVGANQLAALSNQNADRAYVWIYEPRITEQIENPPERIRQLFGGPKPDNPEMIEPLSSRFTDPDPLIFSDEVSGAELELNGLADGTYGVEIWDTWVLKPPTMSTLRVSRGRARWPIPATTRDLALKIKRTGS